MSTTPPGWYPDPSPGDRPGRLRWWDGASWTGHVYHQAAASPPASAVASGYAPQPWAASAPPRNGMSRGVVVAIAVGVLAVIALAGAIVVAFVSAVDQGVTSVAVSSGLGRRAVIEDCRKTTIPLRDTSAEARAGDGPALASQIVDENAPLQEMVSRAEALPRGHQMSTWLEHWNELLTRRAAYSSSLRSGGPAEPPSVLDGNGSSIVEQMDAVMPECTVPRGVLDDFRDAAPAT